MHAIDEILSYIIIKERDSCRVLCRYRVSKLYGRL